MMSARNTATITVDIVMHRLLCIHACFCLLQARAYARNTGEKLETDRSLVNENEQTNPLTDPGNTWLLFLCVFIILNVLVLTSTFLNNYSKMFLWLQRQGKEVKVLVLYKASIIVLLCVNVLALIADIVILTQGYVKKATSDIDDSEIDSGISAIIFVILPIKVLIVLFILCLEPFAVCYNTQGTIMQLTGDAIRLSMHLPCVRLLVCASTCQ